MIQIDSIKVEGKKKQWSGGSKGSIEKRENILEKSVKPILVDCF